MHSNRALGSKDPHCEHACRSVPQRGQRLSSPTAVSRAAPHGAHRTTSRNPGMLMLRGPSCEIRRAPAGSAGLPGWARGLRLGLTVPVVILIAAQAVLAVAHGYLVTILVARWGPHVTACPSRLRDRRRSATAHSTRRRGWIKLDMDTGPVVAFAAWLGDSATRRGLILFSQRGTTQDRHHGNSGPDDSPSWRTIDASAWRARSTVQHPMPQIFNRSANTLAKGSLVVA